ncbi:hypothetical protein BSGG_5328 [Bacteroides sp. D2]|nr:hypothetical protein BSGG_5328 [Bacteroides sp. D2]
MYSKQNRMILLKIGIEIKMPLLTMAYHYTAFISSYLLIA